MPDERTLSSGPCVEPEVLAMYAERRLTPDGRAAVDAHLAGCGDCYALLTEVILTSDDMDGRVPAFDLPEAAAGIVGPRGIGGRRLMAIGGVLAAAAALLLVVRLQPAWLSGRFAAPADPTFAALVEAVGNERYVEARLTGGFRYGPLRPTTRSIQQEPNLSLLAAAGQVQKRAQSEQAPEGWHALGVAYLLTGDVDLAVDNLRKAAEASATARMASDLAAAYLTRATRGGRGEDLPQALAATERALRLDPALLEAHFNKGLVLDELGLRHEARAAWQQYLQLDSSSGWADHARARLAALASAQRRMSTEEAAAFLLADTSGAAALVAADAQLARETVEDALLPQWADVHLTEPAAAERVLTAAGEVGRALTAAGDGITERAVAAVRRAGPDARPRLAAAHRAWREGRSAFTSVDPARFRPPFAEAAALFASHGSPLAFWARHYLAVALYLDGRIKDGEAAAVDLLRASEAEQSPALTGRLRWDLGSMYFQQARFGDVLREYSAAVDVFSRLGERDNTAAMHQSIAETLDRLGRPDEGWRSHHNALRLVPAIREPRRRQAVLTGAGYTALNASLPDAALAFFREARAGALELNDKNYLFEAEAGTGRSLVLGRRPDEAQAHLQAALALEGAVSNASFRSRFGADARLALAEVAERSGDDATVITRTAEVLDRVAAVSSEYRLAHLHLMRGRAFRRLQRLAEAHQALETGIAHLESKRALLQQDSLRISYLDHAWDLYDELVALLALDLEDPEAALAWADRGRGRVLRESHDGEDPRASAASRKGIPAGTAVLFLSATERGVFEWLLRSDRATLFAHRPASPREVRAAVEGVQSSRDADARRRAAARLHAWLLEPMADGLKGIPRLVIVPDSVTQDVPFAWMRDASGVPLVHATSVLLATNLAGASRAEAATPTPDSIAIFVGAKNAAFPDLPELPGAENEARAIATLYPTAAVFRGADASAANLEQAAGTYSVLHVAVHAVADSSSRDRVSLVLSDRLLPSTSEGLRGPLPKLKLAVLAACSTQKGERSRGEVLMHMARPFLLAGADHALVTLWDVDDRSAAGLMSAFYGRLRDGDPPDVALAVAQREALAREPSSWWWAGFAVVAR